MATKKATEQQSQKQKENINFEQGLSRLDEIIGMLERDNVPLDELMKLYEEGVGLLRICNEQLEGAEQKVKILKMSPDATKVYLQDFEESVESEAKPSRAVKHSAKEREA